MAKKSGSAYDTHKIMLEQCALEFAVNRFQAVLENLEIADKYFSKEGHIEDSIRAQALFFTALAKLGNIKKASVIIRDFSVGISDPSRYIPSVVMLNELQEQLRSLISRKEIGVEISGLLARLIDFHKLTQKSRRRIRKEASVIPFAPAKIEIRAFGRAEVIVKNHILAISDWKTQMSRDLFFLFLAHPEGLTKEEVGVIMWQELSPAELKLGFKNAIYRMRHAIGSEAVHFQDNYYQFNRSIDYDYDVQNFLNATNLAKDEKNTDKQIEHYKTAIKLYQGSYLPDMDYSWVIPDRQNFHELAIKNLLDLTQILVKNKRYDEALTYCHKALQEEAFNEDLHRMAMEIYSLMGNKAAVSRQYQQCLNILKDEIGAPPSEATVMLYKTLI